MKEFSEIAKELRKSKHLTQTQLANRLWVQKSIISAYETGARQPSLDMIVKYAKEFRVSTDFLLGVDCDKTISISKLTDSQTSIVQDIVREFISGNEKKHNIR